jgi:glycosyltransferase involved in cell wall biosynthesis
MQNEKDLVSVIITAFNEEKFISQAIDSLLYQSYTPIEVIVVNDGSTDNTKQIINSYSCKFANVKAIHLPSNCGKAVAQNVAFEHCLGQYIAVLGGDDYSAYSRIKTQVYYLIEGEFNFVSSNAYLVDENNLCLMHRPIFFKNPPKPLTLTSTFHGNGFPGGSVLFNRELAEKIYPLPVELPYEDLWFSFIAVLHGKIGYLHEPLTYYRQHSSNSYGLFQKKKFSDFRERYIFIRKRLVPYHEEMKQYLLAHDLWNDEIQSWHEASKHVLNAQLEENTFRRLRICFVLYRNYSHSITGKLLIECLFPAIIIMLRFTRLAATFR